MFGTVGGTGILPIIPGFPRAWECRDVGAGLALPGSRGAASGASTPHGVQMSSYL